MPGIFGGVKFQARVFFWVLNMKLRRTPPVMYTAITPPGNDSHNYEVLENTTGK